MQIYLKKCVNLCFSAPPSDSSVKQIFKYYKITVERSLTNFCLPVYKKTYLYITDKIKVNCSQVKVYYRDCI